jgi:hypothetical protein
VTPAPPRRLYDAYPVIRVPYQRRDEGYSALGSFMEGANSGQVVFTESQPVVMRYEPQVGSHQGTSGLRTVLCKGIRYISAVLVKYPGSHTLVPVACSGVVALLASASFRALSHLSSRRMMPRECVDIE